MRHFVAMLAICVISAGLFAHFMLSGSQKLVEPQVAAATVEVEDHPLISAINSSRIDNNRISLQIDASLQRLAQNRAADMKNNGYYSHASPSGATFVDLLGDYGQNSDIYYCENLNMQIAPIEQAASDWLSSPKHKNCMLNINVSRVGYAIAEISEVTYGEDARNTYIVVSIFGE